MNEVDVDHVTCLWEVLVLWADLHGFHGLLHLLQLRLSLLQPLVVLSLHPRQLGLNRETSDTLHTSADITTHTHTHTRLNNKRRKGINRAVTKKGRTERVELSGWTGMLFALLSLCMLT